MPKFTLLLLLLIFGLPAAQFAQDTFSITAVDSATGEVGSAGASCLDASHNGVGVVIITDVHPGRGVIHTQSYWNANNQNYASSLLTAGHSPQQIIDSLVAHDAQGNPGIRQYGISDFDSSGHPRTAAFTGLDCFDYKNHITGSYYTIQGNILLGQQILDSMEARFLRAAELPLHCRLMEALQGAKVVGADTRCMVSGNSSLSAFVRVANAQGFYTVDLVLDQGPAGYEPIDSLQTLMDQFYPCSISMIAEAQDEVKVTVQPNPATGDVCFHFNQMPVKGTVLRAYGCDGKLVVQEQAADKLMIKIAATDLHHTGVYYYRLQQPVHAPVFGKFIRTH